MNIVQRLTRSRVTRGAFAQSLRRGTILAAIVAGAAATPAQAADATPGPIEIRSCSTTYAAPAEQVYGMGMLAAVGVEIDYVNRADVPARDVTFTVGTDAGAVTLADHGTFAPGILIRHVFRTGAAADTRACRVAAAQFTGRTAYVAPPAAR
jgi:hypothetical protein